MIAACAWAAHTACLKILGNKLPAVVVTFIFYGVALLSFGVILLSQKIPVDFGGLLSSRSTILCLIAAGLTIALTDYFVVRGFALGAPLSLYIPLFCTLGLVLSALAGLLFFSESLTFTKILGFACAAASFFLLAR